MKFFGALLVSASLCISGYGVLRLIGRADGQYGPGPDWQAAHLAGLLGMLLFVPIVLAMARLLPRSRVRAATTAATLIGLTAAVVQFCADIALAALAADKADLSRRADDFADLPGIRPAVYTVGPQLFFIGLIVLAALLAHHRLLPRWSPLVVAVGFLLPSLTLDLLPVTGIGLAIALAPLTARRLTDRPLSGAFDR
ncbi:DUF4386 family protein [Nocardia otitidiscaviarum]|uniref:DUF4386 family protein n=1 Tax=Nocardia otitidiscaviarum TaxID=1823 RepID=A0A516NK64_9NOCA|nr:DUF4386 family protein [Nocardia otitidiscaviarum]MCP9619315.1 DUF4386 family protein [Nocardia otitidiscaviarum]QDP79285.1 DUF4386 family protein [Nocardia otitidiscaviarum]